MRFAPGRWRTPRIAWVWSALNHARRCTALRLFRLASLVLRKGLSLYERRMISRARLGAALAMAKLLERSAGVLLLGLTHSQTHARRTRAKRAPTKGESHDLPR